MIIPNYEIIEGTEVDTPVISLIGDVELDKSRVESIASMGIGEYIRYLRGSPHKVSYKLYRYTMYSGKEYVSLRRYHLEQNRIIYKLSRHRGNIRLEEQITATLRVGYCASVTVDILLWRTVTGFLEG